METFLIRALQLIMSLSLLVIIHEGGHFLFARLFKVRVEKFCLFFDPWFTLFKFKPKRSDTEYAVGWLPLGGYVKIAGMIDESMDTEQMKQPEQPWEFRSKPAWQRLLIMVGGVLFNFLLALFIYSMILFAWGDQYIKVQEAPLGMDFNETAKAVGFQDGDILLSADNVPFVRYDGDMLSQIADAREVSVLCDGKKPVALAGIMGGLNSEIRDTTTEVMFEAAKFARDNIRKSSRALGQSSDASQRYAKGVDEYATEMAMKRALHLVEELGAGKVSKTHKNVNTGNSLEPKTFKTSIKKVNGVLGITVPDEDILRILKGLDFDPEINGDELTLHFPAYREDMEDYPDVAEEVIRMYGYDHINSTFLPTAKVTIGGTNMRQKTILKVKRALCSVGAFEGMHYSFFSPADLDEMEFPEDALERKAIRIMNPINEDLSLMRTTLAPQMIHAMGRNQKRGIFEGRIFEIGNAFIPKSLPLTEYPEERETLCIGAFGKDESFFTLKGMAETVADVLHLTFTYERTEKPFLHPYRTAAILCEGEVVGYLGQVKYEIMKAEAMREDAYVLEINMKALEKWYGKAPVFEPLPKFAEEKRDLALVMNKDITCGQVEECIYQACSFVKDVTLFDVYEGQQIAEDKKSMAFTVLFTPKEEAFQADTVDGYVKKILKQLKKAYEIELRS